MQTDEIFMQIALEEALIAWNAQEVPIGAVLVNEGRIIARAHNAPVTGCDPSAHAEILALRRAARETGNYRLRGAALYVTVEPCLMCAGAIIQARLARLIFGVRDPKGGAVASLYAVLNDSRLNHQVAVTEGVMKSECGEILSRFFKEKRIRADSTEKLACGEIPKWS